MQYLIAERLAQVGMQLAVEQDLDSSARRLVQLAVELEFATDAAFVGHGDLDGVTAGSTEQVASTVPPSAAEAQVGDLVAEHGGWIGVMISDVASPNASWTATLYLAGVTDDARQSLRTLAQHAGVALMAVRDRAQQRSRERHQLALVEAGKSLAQHHDVDELLHHIVDLATKIVGARYGALGVVDETGQTLDRFITVGIDDELKARIGELPTGRGILGVLIREQRPLRLARLQDDPRSSGFPPHHPPMGSFLGVPITTRGQVKGRLYLTEKIGADAFTEEDEDLAVSLASQAGIAIDNAELYTALSQANSELELANEHKSSFLASMSHELRSPLNTILGYTQLLLESPANFDGDEVEDLKIIRGSGQHLLGLISDLLDLSKIEADKVVLRVEEADACQLAREAVTAIQPQLHAGVELRSDIPDAPIPVVVDPPRVRQMLLNVLGNAAKFTQEGAITMSVASDDESVRFTVMDEGPGIPEDDLVHLFESFYQSQDALKRTPREHEGAGLGLAITQRLTHLHGGEVELESELGVGTKVVIRLPIVASSTDGGATDA